jgi:hypothetical protein
VRAARAATTPIAALSGTHSSRQRRVRQPIDQDDDRENLDAGRKPPTEQPDAVARLVEVRIR